MGRIMIILYTIPTIYLQLSVKQIGLFQSDSNPLSGLSVDGNLQTCKYVEVNHI